MRASSAIFPIPGRRFVTGVVCAAAGVSYLPINKNGVAPRRRGGTAQSLSSNGGSLDTQITTARGAYPPSNQ